MKALYSLMALSLIGCSRCPEVNECSVPNLVEERIGKQVNWDNQRADCECAVQEWLQQPLSADVAVQIALLNNPNVQAEFESIGIAQAELVQAGLLQNPILNGYVRFPNGKDNVTNMEFSITQNILDAALIPIRKKIATAEYNSVQLKVADTLLALAFDVQVAFYSLWAEQERQDLLGTLKEASDAAFELGKAQKVAGNINEPDLLNYETAYVTANAELAKSQTEVIHYKEKMNRLMGIKIGEWHLTEELPLLPEQELGAECLEEIALNKRLDLEIARWEVEKIGRTYGIKKWWAYTAAMLGVSMEQEPEGIVEVGPSFVFELPLFNYGQAERARIRALFKQSLERLEALKVQARAEVRSARDRMWVNRELVQLYEKEILPLQEKSVQLAQLYEENMALSVYKLLDIKSAEIQIKIRYFLALRDYWISRAELQRVMGGHP